jgi:putative ATPase
MAGAYRCHADDGPESGGPGPPCVLGDLFSHRGEATRARIAPLADRMRPRSLDDFVGQEAILGPGRLLRRAIAADRVGNLILHGPPGVGKTTLARIIAGNTRCHFSSLNAVLAGVKDLRSEVEAARQRLEHHGLRSILFVDEVHRFNATQQDALLPWVENGTVTLIGATTENPFFEVNKALLSRSRLFRMVPLEPENLRQLLQRALADPERGYGGRTVEITAEAVDHLVNVAGGDARSLLNALELAVETTEASDHGVISIDLAIAEESIQQRAVLYDKQGDAHFDTISAFIKSLRGSDPDAALFWLARMVEAGENPRFIFRRMLIAAGEDIGLADPMAVVVVEACAAAFERVGLPEGLYPLAQAALYLAGTEKSNSVLGFFDALKQVRASSRQQVPAHLRDANRDGKAFGDGAGYRYPHAYAEHWVAQRYLPSGMEGEVFWLPGALGWEGALRLRLQERRAAQLAAAAETHLEQSEVMSAGPDDPELERWLRRQAGAEGERLDALRRRFWQGAAIGRHERVLLLEAHSLLWALDPLEATPEGGVVITLPSNDDRLRLEAQLQLLDSLRRPQLLVVPPGAAELLSSRLEGCFEWVAARQPFRGLSEDAIVAWIAALQPHLSERARWRLLFSQPALGPAGALLTLANATDRGPIELLSELAELEGLALSQEGATAQICRQQLENQGLAVAEEVWEERLSLPPTASLIDRWLAGDSAWRRQLQRTGARTLGEAEIRLLKAAFSARLDQPLPQQLIHRLLIAG